eukprot:c15318_g2_i1.p1 GENE.c15318_g2_i1~~c15318_g2_i1.p1  ORF type:complete len:852 (+),score=199.68 c15318_g2_i1:37-2556(+)
MARLAGVPSQPENANIFRSEPMTYIQLYMQSDAAHDTVEELGKLGLVEFTDLNPSLTSFQRHHIAEIKRCEEIERKLRYFRTLINTYKIPCQPLASTANLSMSIDDISVHVSDLESQILDATRHIDELSDNLANNIQYHTVLTRCEEELFRGVETILPEQEEGGAEVNKSLLQHDQEAARTDSMHVRTVCGTIPSVKSVVLERVLFRITRGHCLVRFAANDVVINEGKQAIPVTKKVFAIFFYGSRITERVNRVVDALGGRRFQFDINSLNRGRQLQELNAAAGELKDIVQRTSVGLQEQLTTIANSIEAWENLTSSEKAIYHTLNKCSIDGNRGAIIGEGWCSTKHLQQVRRALMSAADRSGVEVATVLREATPKGTTPTLFRTNKITVGFQAIVDAYGVAKYQEFNPTPFTVITFPFLFAVMFGDFGHGLLMLAFAVYMIKNESYYLKNKPGEIFLICFGGRYVILLMALFSMYTGAIYNETFSLAADVFGSSWRPVYEVVNGSLVNVTMVSNSTYKFGFDPIWKQSVNELTFTNAFKMKMSIVFGVTQMVCGVCLSAFNYIHYNDMVSLVHVFIPQVMFLTSIFGYMVLLIFAKWSIHYKFTHCAPSILGIFIKMFLGMGAVPAVDSNPSTGLDCTPDTDSLLPNQAAIQRALLAICVISVPWMLLGRPLVLLFRHRKQTRSSMVRLSDRNPEEPSRVVPDDHGHGHGHGHDEEFVFSELMIHNVIHTIEYVLGAVSNTASYLRLWALSLAHAQLSTVFWEKAMVGTITMKNPLFVFVGFAIWISVTIGVLMIMESLSAFLHALRLHWVEFQGKFYSGTGRKFRPFLFGQTYEDDD